ncbi:sulfotransferase domain-containing protein [Rhodovibrionaceae bacterium A322]
MGAIIWLASYPKSGNTWVRAFLHNMLKNPDKPIPINEIDRFTLGDASVGWYLRFTSKKPEEMEPEVLAELRPKVHRALTQTSPDSVFVKTHSFMGENSGVALITQEVTAGGIYIVRNPLDVTLSFADHFGLSIDDTIDVMSRDGWRSQPSSNHIIEFFNGWSQNVQSWTQMPHPALHVVRYEDLIDSPLQTFKKMSNFLGLNPPDQRIKKAVRFSSFKELKKQEKASGFKEASNKSKGFFRQGRSGGWQDSLTEEQVGKIVDRHREQMSRFGYIPKGFD